MKDLYRLVLYYVVIAGLLLVAACLGTIPLYSTLVTLLVLLCIFSMCGWLIIWLYK